MCERLTQNEHQVYNEASGYFVTFKYGLHTPWTIAALNSTQRRVKKRDVLWILRAQHHSKGMQSLCANIVERVFVLIVFFFDRFLTWSVHNCFWIKIIVFDRFSFRSTLLLELDALCAKVPLPSPKLPKVRRAFFSWQERFCCCWMMMPPARFCVLRLQPSRNGDDIWFDAEADTCEITYLKCTK